jgi:hypothetical protein
MRTASKSLQIIALATCFAVHFATNGHLGVSGVRRALQMISGTAVQMVTADAIRAADAAPFAC